MGNEGCKGGAVRGLWGFCISLCYSMSSATFAVNVALYVSMAFADYGASIVLFVLDLPPAWLMAHIKLMVLNPTCHYVA